ncbi:MAG: bifunctional ADP-dependent NAD(P)H-hydrate dehydratase/NAD(P)H-hydrate epimerase [Desulfuromonadia bacterium]
MKLVTPSTMASVDATAITSRGIPGEVLMESAGSAVADLIIRRYGRGDGSSALVVAGSGNNGGDGFVVARRLRDAGWRVEVILVGSLSTLSGDARLMATRLSPGLVREAGDGETLARLMGETSPNVVVDALLGTGLSRPVTGLYAAAVEGINRIGAPVVAVDIPSGIDGATGALLGVAVRADVTVTFGLPKIGLVTGAGLDHAGEMIVAPIGFPDDILSRAPGILLMDGDGARSILRPRRRGAHKGENGHVLIIAGSTGKTGAAHLAASAAVRAGAGLVTLAVPAILNPILEVKSTEAMTLPVGPPSSDRFTTDDIPLLADAARNRDVAAIGPGIGFDDHTHPLVARLLAAIDKPVVLDADALNGLSRDPSILCGDRPETVILTPHPGEMARLCGTTVADVERDRVGVACRFSREYGVTVVLKGGGTVVASPDGRCCVNRSGNPGMATGGMGDLLTGVIAALLGQGYPPFEAAALGVYVHGAAADLVARYQGEIGMTATDVCRCLPHAFHAVASPQRGG